MAGCVRAARGTIGVRGASEPTGETFVSYLNPLRLHFSGSFEAAVSTVNNDPAHYDSARFKPAYAQPASGTAPDQLNGWFNPDGSGAWRLHGCAVTAAFLADGSPAAPSDPVLACRVADSDRMAPAKLVDLDPEQQLVSEIFGLELRIAAASGETLLRGDFEPAAFMDIWDRGAAGAAADDMAAGAVYQSVLTRLSWGDIGGSPFLESLRHAAATDGSSPSRGPLSVKFNVDGFSMAPGARFMMGRLVGTIGPAGPREPRHFVAGRQFMTAAAPGGTFFKPAGGVNFCVASVDHATRRVYLDLGNALPTTVPGGPPSDLGDLTLCAAPPDQSAGAAAPPPLGVLPAAGYTQATWYPSTAGVAVFPPDRPLTDDELAAVAAGPLSLTAAPSGGAPTAVISEPAGGLFVRADQFVFRLNPGEAASAEVYATRFGQPHQGAGVLTVPVPDQLQPDSPLEPGQAPPVAVPADAIRYEARVVTDEQGRALLPLRARDPGRPRGYIDGQVYALCPVLEETVVLPGDPYPFNQWNFVSVLVWSGFAAADPPTWYGDIEPVLRQYANLYPVMRDFLDLGDYDSVRAHAGLLAFAFGLDIGDPNSMPVSRDLSAAKRAAILHWLTKPGDDGKPLLGDPPPPAAPAVAAGQPAGASDGHALAAPGAGATPSAGGQAPPHRGGKASAAGRRPAARRGARRPGNPR
jgi:hypothetical protein